MAVTIQIKRGLLTNLPTLQTGEMAFTIDSNEVYVGDGANNHLVGKVKYGSGAPVGNGSAGSIYVNTTTSGIYLSQGSGWMEIGAMDLSHLSGTLDDIRDGAIYQKVAATEVNASGYVTQINDGTNVVTASQARTHIDNAVIHRSINDSVISNTGLWSSQKINDQLTALVNGVDWQSSVLSMEVVTAPGSPTDGMRYLIPSSGTGDWAAHVDDIAHYITTSGWIYITPNEGFATWVEDLNSIFIYNGAEWVKMSSSTFHNNLSGLQGGSVTDYYHLSGTDYAALVTNRAETITDLIGSTVTASGHITVNYDDSNNLLTIGLTQINHSELGSIGENDHHNRAHGFWSSTSDHDFSGQTMISGYLVGVTSSTSLGVFDTIDGGVFV